MATTQNFSPWRRTFVGQPNALARLASAAALVASLGWLAGCARGAPPGFSSGDQWTMPLVGPLENEVLLVPVMIHDQGPFLFRLDPDAPQSAMERDIAEAGRLAMGPGPRFIDETDTGRQTYVADVRVMKVGTLTVQKKYFLLVKAGTFDTATRRVHGILGRDIIADSLAFGFDRDLGVAMLATQEGFVAPKDAVSFKYELVSNKLNIEPRPVGRRVIEPTIGGAKIALHVDFGQFFSELKQDRWAAAQLAGMPQHATLVDEVGTTRAVTSGGIAAKVSFAGVEAFGVGFVPYADKRWEHNVADGKLGLGAFRDFIVWANWDSKRVYLVPRGAASAQAMARIRRWGWRELATCGDAACLSFAPVAPEATGPQASLPAPSALKITRAAAVARAGMEAIVEVADGTMTQRYVITFMPGSTEHVLPLPTATGTSAPIATVLDISPFHRVCARSATSCGIELP